MRVQDFKPERSPPEGNRSPPVEMLLIALCAVVFLGAALAAVIVFSPVVITLDSRERRLRIRWLAVLEYLRPLPGASGKSGFYIFRRPVTRKPQEPGKAPARKQKSVAVSTKAPKRLRKRKRLGEFFMRCLGDAGIRRVLARQFWKLGKRVGRSVVLARSSADVSLPDPAANGMVAGVLAASPWVRSMGIRVNFLDENALFLEFRFHPHRALKAFLFFLPGLPYWRVFKQWRAIAAARPE
jgi:hypothetical protein